MKSAQYIDLVRDLTKTRTDYAVAKLLRITEDAVRNYRKGERTMSVDVALIVAQALDLPPLQVIVDAQIEHAKDEDTRARWMHLRKRHKQWLTSRRSLLRRLRTRLNSAADSPTPERNAP